MSDLKRVMMAFVILSIFFKQLKNCFFHLLKVKNLWCFYPNNSFFFFAAKKIKVKIEIKKQLQKKWNVKSGGIWQANLSIYNPQWPFTFFTQYLEYSVKRLEVLLLQTREKRMLLCEISRIFANYEYDLYKNIFD